VIATKQLSLFRLAAVIVTLGSAYSCQLHAQNGTTEPSRGGHGTNGAQWSVQVNKVDPGDVNLAPSFRIAIYEGLLAELTKTKQFQNVMRQGDHNASGISNLLILKTTVEKYTAGSETRRAVTTVSGATKLTVRTQLCTPDGKAVLERTVDGNVRFMGSNLKATHNLARNVVKAIKQSSLPAVSPAASAEATKDVVSADAAR